MHDVADLVTVIVLPLALMGTPVAIIFAGPEGRTSRDLEASLSISETVGYVAWQNLLRESEKVRKGIQVDEEAFTVEYRSVANWRNTVGFMVDSRLLARPERVLDPNKSTIAQMLGITQLMVAAWESQDDDPKGGVGIVP